MDKQTKKSFDIKGMMCGACAFTIQRQLLRLKGVRKAIVDFGNKKLKIDYDYKKISTTEIIQSVASFGYTIRPLS